MVTAQIKEHTVFVGNIPYGLTEEQIIHILSQAGQVLNFRLVYDKDTGRPRGYGFAEFSDNDAAASAVRNLNNYETMGRHLRVDWSNDGPSKEEKPTNPSAGGTDVNAQATNGSAPTQNQSNALPPLPPGVELPQGVTCPDAISNTLRTIHPPQLLDTLSQMKNLVDTAPGQATALLAQAPQLSYALFQALLLLGLVDTNMLKEVVQQTAAQPTAAQPSQPLPPQPMPPQNFQQQQPVPQFQQQPQFQQIQPATPPMPQPQYQAPPIMAGGAGPQLNNPEALRQIMAMTQDQIDRCPPQHRDWIMMIRQQVQQATIR